jgi:allantoinase
LPYPRDLRGYGRNVPHAQWPAGAKIAVQFVLNYEEGGENNVLHGDPTSETFLSELVTAQAYENRHMTWSRCTNTARAPACGASCANSSTRPAADHVWRGYGAAALPRTGATPSCRRGYEIANHGLRWIHYQNLPEATERRHMGRGHRPVLKELTGGQWPLGWYTGRDSPNTRRLVVDQGGYEYDSDYYGDDLPFWLQVQKSDGTWRRTWWCPTRWTPTTCASCRPRASTPATTSSPTCATPSTRCTPKATPTAPKMMSIGMHCRLLGKPGRIAFAAALPGPRAVARPGLDLPPHRHCAPLEATHPFNAATAFVWDEMAC